MATAGDSLYAIKKLVYEDVEFSLAEFNDILASNYDNNELLRKRIENKLPKYGNGIDEVDSIAAGMVAQYCDKVRRCKTYIGSPYRPGVYSFYETINRMGSKTPATPNGRKAKTRFSLNAGPDHGVIKNGATSVLKSLTKFSQCMADNACPVDLQLSGGTPPEIIKNIVEYLANHDALFVQTMVANKEDLIKAEERPENYKDLMVRVTGFSANYVALDARTRKEILARSDWN
jgi:formate C-acetyltransferase